jgi:hypothetical protein
MRQLEKQEYKHQKSTSLEKDRRLQPKRSLVTADMQRSMIVTDFYTWLQAIYN